MNESLFLRSTIRSRVGFPVVVCAHYLPKCYHFDVCATLLRVRFRICDSGEVEKSRVFNYGIEMETTQAIFIIYLKIDFLCNFESPISQSYDGGRLYSYHFIDHSVSPM